LPATDPEAPDTPERAPFPKTWRPPEWPPGDEIPVCQTARDAIVAARQAELRGDGEELDGHRLLLREKLAAALDILAGEAEVSEEGWDLAGVVLEVSDLTRATCLEALSASAREANLARGRRDAERAVLVEEGVAEAATKRVCGVILRALERRGPLA